MEEEEEVTGWGGGAGWKDCDWVTSGEEEVGAMAAEGKKEELGRRKEGLLWGMGCCNCLALMRGRVLLVRPTAGRDIPLPTAPPLLPFLMATPPRSERLLLGGMLPDM